MKKYLLLILILLLVPISNGSVNLDTISCKIGGNCTLNNLNVLGDLNVSGSFYTTNVVNINYSGELNLTGCLNFPDGSYVCGNDNNLGNVNINGTLNMTNHSINNVGWIDPILEQEGVPYKEGRFYFDAGAKTWTILMDGGEVLGNVLLESLKWVKNTCGQDIFNGQAVYETGASGNTATVCLADRNDSDTFHVLGIATENIPNNQNGWVALLGDINGVDTSGTPYGEAWLEGDKLYLGYGGNLTTTHPTLSTEATILIGKVKRDHQTIGSISLTSPESFTLGNNFNGTLRQSVINKNNGTNAAVGFTAVNDLNHFTTFGLAGSNNVNFPNEVSVFYAPGYGDHWQAIDGNRSFIWFNDPTDSHANLALNNKVMEIDNKGNLLSNSIYGSLIGDELGTITISVSGLYYNVTTMINGTNNGFIFNETGKGDLKALYNGTYTMNSGWSFSGGANTEYHIRIEKNDLAADNCHAQRKIGTGGDVGSASTSPCIVRLLEGDNISLGVENVDNVNNAFIHDVGLTVIRIGD